jgi:IclR family acetate operon transcriptional repressor
MLGTTHLSTLSTLDRGLAVLLFVATRERVTLQDVVEETGTSKPSAYRVLATLQENAFVERLPKGGYRLGPAARIVSARASADSMWAVVNNSVEAIRDATGETANFASLCGRKIIYTAIAEGRQALRMSPVVGEELPAHATAIGKAILAALASTERRELIGTKRLRAITPSTVVDHAELEKVLTMAGVRGFATEQGETELGSACIAVALLGVDGKPFAGLSIAGPRDRFTPALEAPYAALLKKHAAKISAARAELDGHLGVVA